jgi:hypothetical protein
MGPGILLDCGLGRTGDDNWLLPLGKILFDIPGIGVKLEDEALKPAEELLKLD